MPSVKRKLAELEKERSKIKKTNHSIASFMVSRESVVEAQVQAELPLPTTEPQNNNEPLSTSSITTNSTETDLAMQTTVESMPWQPSTPSQQRKTVKAKHKVGFDPKWNDTRPWLHLTQEETDNGTISVMYCKLCQKHQTKGRNGSVIWNKKGCATLRLDKVVDHEVSEMHKTAIRIETEIQLDIETAMRKDRLPMGENEFKAVTCATKILHFLITHNIPHTTVFKDLVDFATKELKCPDLQHLQKGKNATYTSNSIADEFIDAMVTDIEETLVDRVRQSPGYAVMNDETTDKTNKKHLAFCVKYIDKDTGETCVNYLKDVRIDDGKAETIFRETERVISDVSKDKFVAYASDGCNTMVGKKTGVATTLKEMKPEIVTMNCHNHRLALAAKDSFESIKLMTSTDELLNHVFKYYHSSGNRTGSLERIQQMLDDSGKRKIKQAAHTRWLSHLDAVTSLRDSYHAVVMDMENSVESGTDKVRLGSGPSANGLAKKLKTYESVHTVHFLCDALQPLTNLEMVFEKNDIDLSIVKPRKEAAVTALERLKQSEGISIRKANKLLQEMNIVPSESQVKRVERDEHQFIDNLIERINLRLSCTDIIDDMSIFNMEDTSTFYGNDEIINLADHFGLDSDKALEEWDTLKVAVSNIDTELISKLMKTFPKIKPSTGCCYENIEKLCAAAAVVPVSTAEVERVFLM